MTFDFISSISRLILAVMLTAITCTPLFAQQATPGSRTLMDAHNCYPYSEWWSDRIDRALSTGTPLAIEHDLAWHTDSTTDAVGLLSPTENRPTAMSQSWNSISSKRFAQS